MTSGGAAGIRRVDPAAIGRRAIVLFVPPPAAVAIDAVRRRWDPVMAARIGPHVTLVHDVADRQGSAGRVRAAAAAVAPFRATLTATARWRAGVGGIYVAVDDRDGGIRALRARLADLEAPGWPGRYHPHVTLVHPKYVEAADADAAWAALAGHDLRASVELAEVAVVELGSDGWRTVGQHRLHGVTDRLC